MRRATTFLIAAAIAGAATRAAAADHISQISFQGSGEVTYASTDNPDGGFPFPPPVSVGDPVHVTGTMSFGPSGPPADFTGFAGATAFSFNVEGGATSGHSGGFPFEGGSASFLNGDLTGVGMSVGDEGGFRELSGSGFASLDGGEPLYDSETVWGGRWTMQQWTVHVTTPEPQAWALMLLGFGGLGGAMRRRRAQAACA